MSLMAEYVIKEDEFYTTFICPCCKEEKTSRTKEFNRQKVWLTGCSLPCKYELRKQKSTIDYIPVIEVVLFHPGKNTASIAHLTGFHFATMVRVLGNYYELGFVDKDDQKRYTITEDGIKFLEEWRLIKNVNGKFEQIKSTSRQIPFCGQG